MSESNTDRYKQARFVTVLGAFVNACLGIIKMIGGTLFHSNGLIADGLHSLSDLFTDAMVLIASKYGSHEADEAHPYGHQRIETAATYVLSILLILTGLAIAWDAIHHLRHENPEHPGLMTLPLAGISILANEALFWYTRHIGKKIRSSLIMTNAWHHRSDAASSLIVLVGLIASLLGYPQFDSIAAIIVGALIIKMGINYAVTSIKELIDTAADPQTLDRINQLINQIDGVDKVHQLRTRLMGSDIYIDVHVQVNPMLSVSEGHYIAQHVHMQLKQTIEHVKDVTVHIDPEDDEVTSPSFHLPNRSTLSAELIDAWQQAFPELSHYVLHYLDGKLTIDLIGDFSKATEKALLKQAGDDIKQSRFHDVTLRIQSTPKPIYQG